MRAPALTLLLVPSTLLACAPGPRTDRKAPPEPTPALAPPGPPAPAVDRLLSGADVTELARKQNEVEPPPPSRRGGARPTSQRPRVKKTGEGFAARIPEARRVDTPAYHEGRIFTGGFGSYGFHALDARTGKALWSVRLTDDGATEPLCEGDTCLFNTYSCTLFSLDASTGKVRWSWYLGSPQLATPVVSAGVVYSSYPLENGPPGAPFVMGAFDRDTGKPLWRRWIDSEVNSTPVVAGGRLLFATHVGTLYELDAKTGTIERVLRGRALSPPLLTPEGVVLARDERGRGGDAVAAAHVPFPELELGLATTERIGYAARPAVAGAHLVTVDDGRLVARDRRSGARRWSARLPGDVRVADVGHPMIHAGDSLLVAATDGSVVRVQASSGAVLDRFVLGGGPLTSAPIAHEGWLYAGTSTGKLVAFDTGAPELTGWPMLGADPARSGKGGV